jgi:hypothetical protein
VAARENASSSRKLGSFFAAKIHDAADKAKNVTEKVADKTKDAAHKTGEKLKETGDTRRTNAIAIAVNWNRTGDCPVFFWLEYQRPLCTAAHKQIDNQDDEQQAAKAASHHRTTVVESAPAEQKQKDKKDDNNIDSLSWGSYRVR